MQKSKLLALLLAVVMVASMIVVPAYAEDAYTIKLADADGNRQITAEPGQEVEVYLSIENNPGIIAVGARVNYDPELSLEYVDKNYQNTLKNVAESVSVAGFSPEYTANPYQCYWVMESGTASTGKDDPGGQLITVNGQLAQLVFTAPQKPGTYKISLDIDSDEVAKDFNLSATTTDDVIDKDDTIRLYEDMNVLNCTITVGCPMHSDAEWDTIAKDAWNDRGTLTTGHYQLEGNQTLSKELTVASDQTVCIDLNGHTIAAGVACRTFNNSGTLVIMDSSKEETGAIEGSGDLATPLVNNVTGANISTTGNLYIYGGTISGGHTVTLDADTYAPSASTGSFGGNIYVGSGKLYIYGGTITGGIARRGGNIFVSEGELNMYGGTVTEGNGDYAGNIYIANGKGANVANIYGGTISKGKARTFGPNLYVGTDSGNTAAKRNTVTIYGGTFSGGTSAQGKASIFNLCSMLYILGGQIDDSVGSGTGGKNAKSRTYIYGGTFTNTVVLATTNYENKIFNGEFDTAIDSDYVEECACVDGTTVWHYGTSCDCAYTKRLAQDSQYITQQKGQHTLPEGAESGNVYTCTGCTTELTAATCGHEGHGLQPWLAWDGVASDGHYYVAVAEEGLTLPNQVTVDEGETLCLNLNGQTVNSAQKKRMFVVNGMLNLMDLTDDANGILQGGTAVDGNGGVINCKGTFNLYGGTIQDGYVERSSSAYGGNVYINGGKFTMTGGAIKNGKVKTGSISGGGNIYITEASAEANISGGTIEGGTVEGETLRGGSISVFDGAKVTISGVTISGGNSAEAQGENIYLRGNDSVVEIKSGATIGAGVDPAVADIFAAQGTLKIYGGVTLMADGKEFLVEGAQLFDASEGKYVTYATLDEALAAEGQVGFNDREGDIIALGANGEAEELNVDGYTLDLNGYSLDAESLNSEANGNVVDSSNGKGKVVSESVRFDGGNTMVPVTTDDGTVFEKADIAEKWRPGYEYEEGVSTTAQYLFYINPLSGATAMDDAMKDGTLQLSVHVTWTYQGVPNERDFVLNPADMAEFIENWDNSALVLTLNNLGEVTNLTVDAVIISNGVHAGVNE